MTVSETMNAIVVEEYGGVEQLVHRVVARPHNPGDSDLIVRYVVQRLSR